MAGAAEWHTWAKAVLHADALDDECEHIDPGLSDDDVVRIEEIYGVAMPPDLRILLQTGVPVGRRWPDWRNAVGERAEDLARIRHMFRFDIEHNGDVWPADWGPRPTDLHDAFEISDARVGALPAIFRVYGHRYLLTTLPSFGNAVLSIWQPIDSIVYGFDLADYFAREFRIPVPSWVATELPDVAPWGVLFDL